jgi:hypothetical protein
VALVFCAVVIVGLPSGTASTQTQKEQVTEKQKTVTTWLQGRTLSSIEEVSKISHCLKGRRNISAF